MCTATASAASINLKLKMWRFYYVIQGPRKVFVTDTAINVSFYKKGMFYRSEGESLWCCEL